MQILPELIPPHFLHGFAVFSQAPVFYKTINSAKHLTISSCALSNSQRCPLSDAFLVHVWPALENKMTNGKIFNNMNNCLLSSPQPNISQPNLKGIVIELGLGWTSDSLQNEGPHQRQGVWKKEGWMKPSPLFHIFRKVLKGSFQGR